MLKRATLVATALALAPLTAGARAADTPVNTTPVTDGPVNAAVYDSQGRAYVGGSFGYVGPRLGSGIAFESGSNAPTPAVPDVAGSVLAAAPDGAGGEFIGGSFTSVGGVPRARLAHIFADGTLDANWNPGATNTVLALALSPSGDAIYVGGAFNGANSIGGKARSRVAKLSPTTGEVDAAWSPAVSGGTVQAIAVSATHVYIGGGFFGVGAVDTPRVARLSASGAGDPDPAWLPVVQGSFVRALALSGPDLYVGGAFFTVGGQTRFNLAEIASGGAGVVNATWDPEPDSPVNALQLSGSGLFVGGQFIAFGGAPAVVRPGLAKLPTSGTGAPDATWNPGPVTFVDALALSGSNLVVGGTFTQLGGADRNRLASVSISGTGATTSWDPNVNGEVHALAASGSSVFAGGDFSSAGPGNEFRGGLIRLNPNGSLDKQFAPNVEGGVAALSLEGNELFIGGDLFKVYGQFRAAIAKLSTAGNGSLDATWTTEAPNGPVNALARSGNDLYVGGNFAGTASIGGKDRTRLAKVSTNSPGTVDTTWNPSADSTVRALVLSGGSLFAGGDFFTVGGQSRDGLAKLSTAGAGGADATWNPQPGAPVFALASSGSSVFAGGLFNGVVGGQLSPRVAKLSNAGAGNADGSWAPSPNARVNALATSGADLYVGGDFSSIRGEPRSRLARLSIASGALDPVFNPATVGGTVSSVAATPTRVLVGGSFNTLGPLSTSGFGIFDLTAPTLSLTSPFEGARYRQGQEVAAAYSCDDPDGGIDSVTCTGNVASGAPIDTASAGAKAFTATATDAGGKSATSTVAFTVDGSAPDISIAVPAEGAVLPSGTQIPVAFSCTDADGPSDVATCVGSAPNGSQLDVSAAGAHTFTVTSTDLAGNANTKTVSYSIPAGPAAPLPGPPAAPALSALKIKPAQFKVKGRASVSFQLSTAASVTFTVTRKSGKRIGSFTRTSGKKGANKFTFRGKVKRTTLKPGRYRLSARAKGPTGLQSQTLAKPFRIVKR